MRRNFFVILTVLLIAVPAVAQLEIPRQSQKASVAQTIGTTQVTINYHRPGVRGRAIWGALVPWDQPWRMGANEATTIEFSGPVKVEGQDVPAGKYSFFAIPAKDKWTLVLNKDPEQWGAYGYDASKDQLRASVTPSTGPRTEFMRFTIDPVTPSSAIVNLNWDTVAVPMRVDVDVASGMWTAVDAAMKKLKADEAQTLAYAANWALDSGERVSEGLTWLDQSIAISGENVFNQWTRARLLHKLGRTNEAIPVIEKSLTMAKTGNMPADFIRVLEGTQAEIRGTKR